MQVILSEEEYNKLIEINQFCDQVSRYRLQELCKIACNRIPVDVDWLPKIEPWGCILNYGGNGSGYCDECPVETYCPNEDKKWSK